MASDADVQRSICGKPTVARSQRGRGFLPTCSRGNTSRRVSETHSAIRRAGGFQVAFGAVGFADRGGVVAGVVCCASQKDETVNKYLQLLIGGLSAGIGQYLALFALGVIGPPLILSAALTALTTMGGMLKNLPQREWTEQERAAKNVKEIPQ